MRRHLLTLAYAAAITTVAVPGHGALLEFLKTR